MEAPRARLYRSVFVVSMVALAIAMALGLYEVVIERETPPSMIFQNIAEIELLMQEERYDEAISRLGMTLALFPSNHQLIHNMLGNAYTARGDHQMAIDHYRRALDYDPVFAEAHNNLGVALARIDRRAEALAEWNRAIDLRPGYGEAYDNMARVLRAYDRDATAEDGLAELVESSRRRLADAGRPLTVVPSSASAERRSIDRARVYFRLLLEGDLSAFHRGFTKDFASRTTEADLVSLVERLNGELGDEVELLGERVIARDDYDVYIRVSRFSRAEELVEWTLVLDDAGSIADMRVRLGTTR